MIHFCFTIEIIGFLTQLNLRFLHLIIPFSRHFFSHNWFSINIRSLCVRLNSLNVHEHFVLFFFSSFYWCHQSCCIIRFNKISRQFDETIFFFLLFWFIILMINVVCIEFRFGASLLNSKQWSDVVSFAWATFKGNAK